MIQEELNKTIIEVCLKIAKRGEGAIILVGNQENKPLVKQEVKPFNVIENPKLLESLALMDGAVIVDKFGLMQYYGTMLKVSKLSMIKNFGTRHQSSLSASMKEGNKVYVVSEEDNKVRIFQDGKLVVEIDGRTKNIEKQVPEINNIMESIGWGTASLLGAGIVAPAIGIAAIPGVTIFVAITGVSYFIKKLKKYDLIK